jgi:LysM repeat protein
MASTIGIKIANGEFYSIIEENSTVKKRLVLTTVHDKQTSVQIDLYKSYAKTMADALYIGSLVVENIKPKPKGEPSIEMVISSNARGDITADAIDMDTSAKGEHQVLSVSLKSLDEDNRDVDIPDFELEQHEGPPTGLYDRARKIKKNKDAKKSPVLAFVLTGLVIILLILGLWFFFLRQRGIFPFEFPFEKARPAAEAAVPAGPPPASPPVQPVQTPPPVQTAPVQTTPPPVIQAPSQQTVPRQTANRVRPPAPVSFYNVPAIIPKEGAPYKIRWGDTLWDISEAFYRNPWLYPRIARFNQIRNPNLIISGTTIRIPPKN